MCETIRSDEIESAIEGILFAAGEPVEIEAIAAALQLELRETEVFIKQMEESYQSAKRGIRLIRIEDKIQLCTKAECADYIRTALAKKKIPTLSKAALEVLAVIAYRQPTTRAYIEHVRGVDSSNTVSLLEERGLVEDCGRLDVPGRPILYKTTDQFLRSFGISGLSQLPSIDAAAGKLPLTAQGGE